MHTYMLCVPNMRGWCSILHTNTYLHIFIRPSTQRVRLGGLSRASPAQHHTTPHQFIRNQKFGTPSPVLVVSSGQQPDHLLFVFRSVQYNFYFFKSVFRLIPSSPFRSSRVLPSVRTAAVQFSSVPGGSAYPFKVFL